MFDFKHPNNMRRGVQIMKSVSTQFSPFSLYFHLLRPEDLPRCLIV